MEFKVLGALEVGDGDGPIEVTAPQQRAVLAVLLVSANQVVSFDRIIWHLWGDAPPRRATATVQMYVSSLRRAFEPRRAPRSPGRVLLSKPPGYLLVVDPNRFDAARFTADVAAAQSHLAAGEPAAASDQLDAALALWRGPAYAEFADQTFALAEAARLETLRVVALETRAEASLALGRHVAAASELEGLVARHPFREGLWASYLLALYRSGRQADALRAYQACRTRLTEELGIGPGAPLRRLEAAILAQDPSLDGPSAQAGVLVPPPPSDLAPGEPAARAGAGLVGRRTELQRLEEAWQDAAGGRGTCVLVSGEAGIGKTRLVEELAARATAGGDVVWGRCQEGGDAPAFWPWAQVVRSLLASRAPGAAAAVLDAAGLEMADLAPLGSRLGPTGPTGPTSPTSPTSPAGPTGRVEPSPPIVDPGTARFRLYQAATTLVTALAAERPVMVVLDDVHWADVATLQLFQAVAADLSGSSLLLVATYRDGEVADDHPLVEALAAVARRSTVERVRLGGFSPAEVGSFVTKATGAAANPAVVASVHRRTGGNPFFVGELVRLLESEGVLDDPTAAVGAEVPAGVRDVIRRRLGQLPEDTNALLAVAAVVGQEFDLAVVEGAAGRGEDDVVDALEPARLRGVIVESPGSIRLYRFSHALLHETLYDGMSALRRARLHVRVAEALEGGCTEPRAVEVAHHLWRAMPVSGPERVLPVLLRAAEEALGGVAYEQAGEQLERALELISTLPPGEDRDRQELWAQVRLGMVRATTQGNPAPGVATSFARARELCARVTHSPEQLPALYGLFLVSWIQVDFPSATTYAGQLLEVAQSTHDPTFVVAGHQARGLIAFERGDLATARHHFSRSMVTADLLADPWLGEVMQGDPSVTSRSNAGFVEALYGNAEAAAALAAEALERARQSGHSWTIGVALATRAWVSVVLRDADHVDQHTNEAAAHASEWGFQLLAAASTSMRGWSAAFRGDVERGLDLERAGFRETEAIGMRLMMTFQLTLMAEVEHWAGLTAEALATVERGLAEVECTGEAFFHAELLRLRGELLAASEAVGENAVEAEASFTRAMEIARRQGAGLLEQRAAEGLHRLRERMEAVG